ncbi:class D sortase [Priestia megaterium]|uniref:Class D sortase n=1 Tax=Priestia megaterium TaxID=1404 RepID=A0A6M6E2Y0_PRIMG|nr:class D sortase [Priestia megaterium]QJX80076.1 class D sortase [Priestia megaterium]
MRIFGIILFVVGISLAGYSFFEWNVGRSSSEALTQKEIQHYEVKEKENVNQQNTVKKQENPNEDVKLEQIDSKSPEKMEDYNYDKGQKVANLVIPKLELKYSVYWGTDADTLKRGVGMFVSDLTTTPSGKGHTVLSGHRDTVFTRLGELKLGDKLIVEFDSKLYEYQIKKIWITHKEDRTVIVSKNKPTLTLTTCYPFDMIGKAPDRYIIEAEMIDN